MDTFRLCLMQQLSASLQSTVSERALCYAGFLLNMAQSHFSYKSKTREHGAKVGFSSWLLYTDNQNAIKEIIYKLKRQGRSRGSHMTVRQQAQAERVDSVKQTPAVL